LKCAAAQITRRDLPKARRRGQALLLAVLLMIFVALLGSTFVTVVALNMNQTARQEELSGARIAAQAGINFANTNLTYSPQGLNWRPEMLAPPPAPGDADYNTYYTAFEQAQGWARTIERETTDRDGDGAVSERDDWVKLAEARNSGLRTFVKFPDPRQPQSPIGTPTYLAEVHSLPVDPSHPGYEVGKEGMLQITVIGQSTQNPTVFDRRVAYKAGLVQSPLTSNARAVMNWDFFSNTVPIGFTSVGTTTSQLKLERRTGRFPSSPFYATLVDVKDPFTTTPSRMMRTVLVQSVDAVGNTLSLATPLATIPATGLRVEMTAALGAPGQLDYNNDGVSHFQNEAAAYRTSHSTTAGGIRVNGNLLLLGNAFASNLRSPQAPGTVAPGGIRVSSFLDVRSDPLNSAATPLLLDAVYREGNAARTLPPTRLQGSNQGAFPFGGNIAASEKAALVDDGAFRLTNRAAIPGEARQVTPQDPPSLNAKNGLDRYRQLTKFSAPANRSHPAAASLFGYGQGIYLNNPEDVETVGTGTAGGQRPMTQTEMRELWLNDTVPSPTTANRFYRLGRPGHPTNAASAAFSLEEQHLRGWIGPDEFRARGALIELKPDPLQPKVVITLETRADNIASDTTRSQGTLPGKAWRDENGNFWGSHPTKNPNGGVYQREFDWPANGVIFAEGNVRIRGGAFDGNGNTNTTLNQPRHLTVISMNNIYIEGSLNAGNKKVLLLARRNVVLNPTTAVLHRVDTQTRLREAISSNTSLLRVTDAGAFRPGEWVNIVNTRRQIVGITGNSDNDPTNDTVTVSPAFNTSTAAGTFVSSVTDPPSTFNGFSGTPFTNYATRVERFDHRLQRRLALAPGTNTVRFAFRHNAQRREALRLNVQNGTFPGRILTSAQLQNKPVDATDPFSSVLRSENKVLTIDYNQAVPAETGTEKFLTPLPNSAGAGRTYLNNPPAAQATPHPTPDFRQQLNNAHADPDWKYNASIQGGWEVLSGTNPTPNPRPPLFYFLAAWGNRNSFGLNHFNGTAPPLPIKTDVLGRDVDIPMATSVALQFQGAATTLWDDRFNTVPAGRGKVQQFGFNPLFGDSTNPEVAYEDVLTSDQSFYSNGPARPGATPVSASNNPEYDNVNFTLDSRVVEMSTATPPDALASLAIMLHNPIVPGPSPVRTLEDFFNATGGSGTAAIPFYRLSRLKLENEAQFNSSTGRFEKLTPGNTLDVRAYVYAQEGSWVVIPGSLFDDKIRMAPGINGTYLDSDGNAVPNVGEYVNADANPLFSHGDFADLDRDGVFSPAEQIATHRFRRYNYQIRFVGAITENHSLPVLGEGNVKGAVQDWMDKWATIQMDADQFDNTSGNFRHNVVSDVMSPSRSDIGNITYEFDAAVINPFDPAHVQDAATFALPATADLIYQ
jgi:hypothetical protein